MASEPAETTTRPQDDVIEQAARLLASYFETSVDGPNPIPAAEALADAGLLADPAQTTELEKLKAHVSDCHRFQNNVAHILGVDTDWDEAGRKAVEHAAIRAVGNLAEARRDFEAMKPRANGAARQLADLRDELATAREETAAAHDLAEMRAEDRTETDAKLETLLAQREQWWESVAKQRHEVEGQRDALSLLLRGMARKLVAYRAELKRLADACREYEAQIVEWREEAETGGNGWGMFRTRQALGTPDGRAVSAHAAEVRAERDRLKAGNEGAADRIAELTDERDDRQARIDAALVECDREYPIGRVPIDEWPSSAQICDRVRVALQGDQPTEHEEQA